MFVITAALFTDEFGAYVGRRLHAGRNAVMSDAEPHTKLARWANAGANSFAARRMRAAQGCVGVVSNALLELPQDVFWTSLQNFFKTMPSRYGGTFGSPERRISGECATLRALVLASST